MDTWAFDIFELNDAADNHALKYIGAELLHKYNLISKFKVRSKVINLVVAIFTKSRGKYRAKLTSLNRSHD